MKEFYTWKKYRCAYEFYSHKEGDDFTKPLLLLHPIGVGLSKNFWHRFCGLWQERSLPNPIYNPDLLGCGESDMPSVAYYPMDWAEQLQYFLETVVQKPVILVVQGALFPVAVSLVKLQQESSLIDGLILSGPPQLELMTKADSPISQKLRWNLFYSPVGKLFYLYARSRKFLDSFSKKQLFANEEEVDKEWLDTLEKGAKNLQSQYAVFSFLAGFWRQDFSQEIARINQPTLVLVGKQASTISKTEQIERPEERINSYLKLLPQGEGCEISGRNVLPYESTEEFIEAVSNFYKRLVNSLIIY
ncbi:alpha/beta fold hydrolase [Okeania sp. KiyG1]|uniref:alpha/beta fold hydrolase n=1 Tax=Okeania sp. KiyG1 TaxID=2720165 RepID=UPI0019227C6E|nr:alpha/beta hydrolase [Okeania sp. KiyG1]GGA55572.1 alpha/beta hydrolase [Okeania sp. KiyG1]